MQQYHEFITNSTGSNAELAPPMEIAVNKNNIEDVEKVILDVYQRDAPKVALQDHRGFTILGTDA